MIVDSPHVYGKGELVEGTCVVRPDKIDVREGRGHRTRGKRMRRSRSNIQGAKLNRWPLLALPSFPLGSLSRQQNAGQGWSLFFVFILVEKKAKAMACKLRRIEEKFLLFVEVGEGEEYKT